MIGAAICIGTAVLIAYLLGRYHGMAAAFESLRPISHSYGEAPGDCFPVHSPTIIPEAQSHHA